ncbi:MAG: hypothetical protein PHV60_06915 [bacterium]|nr:hypothetical protein [bacterium]
MREEQLEKYRKLLGAANMLAEEGKYALALELVKASLERIYLEREFGEKGDQEEKADVIRLESETMKKYLEYKARLNYHGIIKYKTILNTVIIALIISFSLVLTSYLVIGQLKNAANDPVKAFLGDINSTLQVEIPKITGEIRSQIPQVTQQIRAEMPRMTDKLAKIIDDKIKDYMDNKIEKVVDEKLPFVVKEQLAKKDTEKDGK